MIKQKLLKYSFISLTVLILLIAGFLLRISHKPFDIGFITKYIGKDVLNEILPFSNLKSATVHLNIFENTIKLNLDDVKEFKLSRSLIDMDILISSAKNINLAIKATKLFKKELDLKYININDAKIKTLLNKQDYNRYISTNEISLNKLPASLNSIKIKNTELIVYLSDKFEKIIFTGLDFKILNNFGEINFNKIKANQVKYEDNKKKLSIKINSPEFYIKEKSIKAQASQVSFLNLQEENKVVDLIKSLNAQSNEIIFNNINFQFNSEREFYIKTDFDHIDNKIPLEIQGGLSNEFYINTEIKLELNEVKIPSKYFQKENTLNINLYNASNFLANGYASIKMFENKFLASSFNIKLKNYAEKQAHLTYQDLKIPISDLSIKANILEDQLEIEQCILNNSRDEILVKGKIDNFLAAMNAKLDISIKQLNLIQFKELFKNYLNSAMSDEYKISDLKSGTLRNTDIFLNYFENNFLITSLNGKLLDTKIHLENDFLFDIEDASLSLSKEDGFIINTEKFIISKDSQSILLEKNILKFQNGKINQNKKSFIYETNIKTDYKKLVNLFSQLDYTKFNNINISNLEGNIDANIIIEYSVLDSNLINYNLEGRLINFNFINKNQEFPVIVENFNGDVLFENNLLYINGKAEINKSPSKILINLNEDNKLQVDINSKAIASSFDFLEEYNFLKSGTTMLKMRIIKDNLFDDRWSASMAGNLYNNTVQINEILYKKEEKKRGLIKANYLFEGVSLKKVEDLTLITDDIIMIGDIFLNDRGYLKKIDIKEFVRELDNYKASIFFEENDNFKLVITGSSLNINNYFREDAEDNNNGSIAISIDSFYLNSFNLGSVKISSNIKNNDITNLQGDIYHKNKSYVFFNYYYDLSEYNKFKINFKDFGLFLFNIGFSDKFISGSGDIILNIDNKSKKIISGEYIIKDFSLKDASFLARLLQLASFTGLLEILASEGIPFTNLEGTFKVEDSQLLINDTRFEGLSLGASTKGSVDLEEKKLDLKGVLIPAYAINDIINKIPLLGQIITGIEGEGIIGFDYKATGSYENPEYSINPFSILTPGIIRSIFKDLGKNSEDKPNKSSK